MRQIIHQGVQQRAFLFQLLDGVCQLRGALADAQLPDRRGRREILFGPLQVGNDLPQAALAVPQFIFRALDFDDRGQLIERESQERRRVAEDPVDIRGDEHRVVQRLRKGHGHLADRVDPDRQREPPQHAIATAAVLVQEEHQRRDEDRRGAEIQQPADGSAVPNQVRKRKPNDNGGPGCRNQEDRQGHPNRLAPRTVRTPHPVGQKWRQQQQAGRHRAPGRIGARKRALQSGGGQAQPVVVLGQIEEAEDEISAAAYEERQADQQMNAIPQRIEPADEAGAGEQSDDRADHLHGGSEFGGCPVLRVMKAQVGGSQDRQDQREQEQPGVDLRRRIGKGGLWGRDTARDWPARGLSIGSDHDETPIVYPTPRLLFPQAGAILSSGPAPGWLAGLGIRDWGLGIRCLPDPRLDRTLEERFGVPLGDAEPRSTGKFICWPFAHYPVRRPGFPAWLACSVRLESLTYGRSFAAHKNPGGGRH